MTNQHRTCGYKPHLVGEKGGNETKNLKRLHQCNECVQETFMDHLKLIVFETPMASIEDLAARIIVTSADIASTPDLFERVRTIHRQSVSVVL
ncbi:hypothetical protein TNCV_2507761 [Trichonephila clavipes]|nr:hypothetical protein TNCV_2507761 [Trichonephila clavipes]